MAWRPRHDAFAEASRALRLASPQGPAFEAVASLGQALEVHATYEEGVLWPRYAEVAPPDGPGSLRALHRDHALLRGHLARAADPDPLRRAWALARLEGVLEHHDLREGTHVLPALEALGVQVDLSEPPVQLASIAPAPLDGSPASSSDWPAALTHLATGRCPRLPDVPDLPKARRAHEAYEAALIEVGDPTRTLLARREALLTAFDRALELAWMSGQAKAPWLRRLRVSVPTTPR